MSLALLMAGLQIGGGLASKLLEEDNPKLARNIETLIGSFTAGAQGMSSLAGAFKSPSTGNGLGISNYEDFKGALTKDYGAFDGALPKGGNFDLSEDMMGGGFGLKMPKDWNKPKNKGLFDFTPQDTLQGKWDHGLAIDW